MNCQRATELFCTWLYLCKLLVPVICEILTYFYYLYTTAAPMDQCIVVYTLTYTSSGVATIEATEAAASVKTAQKIQAEQA